MLHKPPKKSTEPISYILVYLSPHMYDLNAIVCMDKDRRLVRGNAKADTNLQKLIQVTKDSMSLLTKTD